MQQGQPAGGSRLGRRRLAVILLGVVVIAALLLLLVATLRGGLAPFGSSAAAPDGSCTARPGARLQDIDEEDSAEAVWPHTPGQRVTVYFETQELPARYAGFVRTAAQVWSRSPCIDARAVQRCPAGSNCSTVVVEDESPDGDTDGESKGNDRNGVRRGNALTLYTDLLDEASDNGALVTVTHEMGHALGLVHRLDKSDLMNANTNDRTNPVPDEIDYANLLVIYGGGDTGS